ncbi:MAG: glycosyltransferase family 39 protein [Anaerolineae bacterium]|nr:glycosyltransferase family 39 protein [Anaerolineae bacterium]
MTDTNNDELQPLPGAADAEEAQHDSTTDIADTITADSAPPDAEVVAVSEDDDGEDEYTDLPPWQRAIIAIGSLGMAYYAQINLFRDPPDAVYSGNILILLGGIAVFFVMIFNLLRTTILQLGGKLDAFPAKQVQRFRLSLIWVGISLAIMAYVAWRTVERPPMAFLWEHLILSIVAMVSLYIALRISKKSPKIPDNMPFLRWEYIAMIGLVVAALLIRGINLENLPYMLDQDEGAFAREGAVLALRENYRTSPYEIGTYSYTRWHQLMIGLATNILGVDKTAARLPSVIMGSFAVLAIYLLGRELYNRQMGLVAALFALGWTYHIHFSRLALNQPGDPLFSTLALYFLLRGLRRRTVINYYYSGLFLGIAQFFYLGARLVPIVMVAYLIWLYIRQREVIAPQWKLLLVVPLTAFVMTMPQNYFIYYFKEPFTTRFDKSIFNDSFPAAVENGTVGEFIRNQIVFSFTGFIASSDRGGWYGVGSNMMDPFGGPLLILGALVTLVLFWARPKWVLPLGWGLGVVIGGSVINNTPPAYERYHPGVAAFSLLCAVGIWVIVEGLVYLLNRPRLAERALIAAGGVVFVLNLGFYVFDFVPAKNYFNNRPNWQTNAVSDFAVKAYNAGHQVVLLGGFESGVDETNVLRYFMANKDYIYLDEPFPPQSSKAQEIHYDEPLTFIIAPRRATDDLETLKNMFKDGVQREVTLTQDGSTAFWVYETGTPTN